MNSSIIVFPVMRISLILQITEMPDFIDAIPEKNRWKSYAGSMYPWTVIKWSMVPDATVIVEVTTPVIKQIVGDTGCNVHIKCRRKDELRCFIDIHFGWSGYNLLNYDGWRWRGLSMRIIPRDLITVGIHALDIGIVISALSFPAIGLA